MSKIFLSIGFLAVLTITCSLSGPSAEQIAATMVAQTAAAAPTVQELEPTISVSQSPTATIVPPTATDTPLPTPTSGPLYITDDFSTQSDIWGSCDKCEWKNGMLYFGPCPPKGSGWDQIFYVICEACGERTYYRVSADVTFVDGYGGDRTYGLLAGLTGDNSFLGAATISTNKHALYETFNFNTREWGGTPFKTFGAVSVGKTTNTIEVILKPGASEGQLDISVNINGTNVINMVNQRAEPTQAGLYLGWHSVGVTFDNFEYEEIVP